jgi:hypothetical protein
MGSVERGVFSSGIMQKFVDCEIRGKGRRRKGERAANKATQKATDEPLRRWSWQGGLGYRGCARHAPLRPGCLGLVSSKSVAGFSSELTEFGLPNGHYTSPNCDRPRVAKDYLSRRQYWTDGEIGQTFSRLVALSCALRSSGGSYSRRSG